MSSRCLKISPRFRGKGCYLSFTDIYHFFDPMLFVSIVRLTTSLAQQIYKSEIPLLPCSSSTHSVNHLRIHSVTHLLIHSVSLLLLKEFDVF